MPAGLTSYGVHVPYNRLQRKAIGAALGTWPGKGERAVASYDEDPTSMGVEAARTTLRSGGGSPAQVLFSTANPPYVEKTSATTIHAALALDPAVAAVDLPGSVRSASGAVSLAVQSPLPTLVVLADVRTGLPGGSDESTSGDAAAALLFGEGEALATVLARATATGEFLDRWRLPGEAAAHVWEERFGEHAYVPLADAAFADALKQADLTPGQVDHLVVVGSHPRAAKAFAARCGVAREALADDLATTVGHTGSASVGLGLAGVLDTAAADAVIALVVLADGAEVFVLRTTGALASWREAREATAPVAAQVAAGDSSLPYASYLTWRGLLDREPPRRPDPQGPAGPPTLRNTAWKYSLTASRCTACGTRHLPPARVCLSCHEVDQMAPEPMADALGTVATFTIDRLAFTPSPPLIAVVIDFDGGGRMSCELTDATEAEVAIGLRVRMSFRRVVTAQGLHSYFWKARPVREQGEVSV